MRRMRPRKSCGFNEFLRHFEILNIYQEIWLSFHKNISMLQNKLQSEMSWKKCFFGSIKIEHFCVSKSKLYLLNFLTF